MDQMVGNVRAVLCICERETQVKAQRKQSCIHQLLLLISRFIGLINVELNRTPVETTGEISLSRTPTPTLSLFLTASLTHLPFSISLRGHNGANFLEEKLCLQPAEKIRGNMSSTQAQATQAVIARVGERSWLRTQKHLLRNHSKQTPYIILSHRETQPQCKITTNCVLKGLAQKLKCLHYVSMEKWKMTFRNQG